MLAEPDPRTTLLVVLGASTFPKVDIKSSKAFRHAAHSVVSYFLSDSGFGLPIENAFWFFDSEYDPNTLDDQIATRVKTRVQQLQASDRPAADLIVFYVGHGSFDEERRYYLALRSTRQANQSVSSLRIEALMITLNSVAQALRKFLIIDACFAGEGAAYSQSNTADALGQQIRRLPQRGTAFLCSSSRDQVSEFLPDETNTVFTKALSESLWDGRPGWPPKLSFEQLLALIEDNLREKPERFIRPEIHTPQQPEGDIAKVALFPNGPRRMASLIAERERIAKEEKLLAYLRHQEDEQARHAEKLLAEKQARDDDIRQELLAAQRREQELQSQLLRHYDSETEKRFREEAEDARDYDLDPNLLISWLNWKKLQSEVLGGARRQAAIDHKNEASQNSYYAENIWDRAGKEAKSGSDQYAAELRSHWQELIQTVEVEQQKAVASTFEAEDADIASQFYSNMMHDADSIHRNTVSARASGRSFQEFVDLELSRLLTNARHRRRMRAFLKASWIWTRRVCIVGIVLFLLGLWAKFSGK